MRSDDLNAVLEVAEASFVNPWTRDMLTWEIGNAEVSRIYILRTSEHHVAAFCSCWLILDDLHINNLAVRPECRRRGLGRALIEHVLQDAGQAGARRVTLEVRRSNEAALRLYERVGFRIAGSRPNYYRDPPEDALILWRSDLEEFGRP